MGLSKMLNLPAEQQWSSPPILSRVPSMMVPGNHDIEGYRRGVCGNYITSSSETREFVAMNSRYFPARNSLSQSQKLWYSRNVGLAHIIVLCPYCRSQDPFDEGLVFSREQIDFLRSDASAVDRDITPWIIVATHVPIYVSNLAHLSESRNHRRELEPVLIEAGVDIVFSGHSHCYQRSARVKYGSADATGPSYIVIGTGGNREGLSDKFIDALWSVSENGKSYGFGQLEIHNESHAVWKWYKNPRHVLEDRERKNPAEIGDTAWLVRGSTPMTNAATGKKSLF